MAAKKEETTAVAKKEETAPAVKHDTDFTKGIFGTSDNFLMASQMAKAFAQSTIVPKEYQGNMANGLVALDMANRLQTSPLTVMQNLHIIQGRPSWSSSFLIGVINSSGLYDFELQFEEKQKDGKPYSCSCWTEKNGRKVTGIEVTMDMARDEGWLGKNGSKWKTMPQLMLRYRAAAFFSRLNCPELTLGLYTKEEAIEIGETEYQVYDLQEEVANDLKNANKEEFAIEPDGVDAEVVEEPVDIPDFAK